MWAALGCDAKRVDVQHVGGHRAEQRGGGGVSSAWLVPVAAPSPPGAGTSSPSASPQSCRRAAVSALQSSAGHQWSHSAGLDTLKALFIPNIWRTSSLTHSTLSVISVVLLLSIQPKITLHFTPSLFAFCCNKNVGLFF